MLDLINIWMTTLIPIVTEILKRQFPELDSRIATVITLAAFVAIFYLIGEEAVELFVSIVTALAAYGLVLKPVVFTPLMGERKKRKKRPA